MVANLTFGLDQVCHAPSGPQGGFVSERHRPASESLLDAPQVSGVQARLASRASRLPQRPSSALFQLLHPAAHRLAMHPNPPGHLRLGNALPHPPSPEEPPLSQLFKFPSYSVCASPPT